MKKLPALLIALPLVFLPATSWAGDDDESGVDKIIEFLFGNGDDDDDPAYETPEAQAGDGSSSKKRLRVAGQPGSDGTETGGNGPGTGGQDGPSPAVPEPSGVIAFGLGALILGRIARARRR